MKIFQCVNHCHHKPKTVYIPVFHFTASFEVVSLFLLIAELFLLPPQLLAFTCHALCFFATFLKVLKYTVTLQAK